MKDDDELYIKFQRQRSWNVRANHARRLFEPFFTTKPKGTGLGLATVHKILELHDAKIFVESHEDKGTEFTIRFNELIVRCAANEASNSGGYEGQNTGS